MPFALLATFLAASAGSGSSQLPHGAARPTAIQLVLIVVCMVFARTFAMGVNRYADADFDAANPRTVGRAIPAGRLSRKWVFGAVVLCALGCVAGAAGFWMTSANFWPLALSPLVLAWLGAYSYMKRVTWLCHLHLGASLALAPIAASIAIYPPFVQSPEPWLLAAMVMTWVAGFDIIYALQDVDVDRKLGLFSMPARLGPERALWIARTLHIASVACLVALAVVSPVLHTLFAVGIGFTVGLLVFEHVLVWRSESRNIPLAFLTVNGVISLLLGAAGIVDILRTATQ